ncbi:restriction endonuclease subunit S [Lactobacillus sp. W8089]|nr:restriction endonuclease subunit S [Lactobacillus sp. W8086]MBI0108650.1 restriction endonuclease subunit S [Lactobacillus sp. W8085]MBI0111867.1 restriction endonuclease subunit S [Lactobacillus sp. W8088]MBI0115583.1 restriction endonuclease subunit S [Lactobacillus sp. W8087]MBI0119307.1 restriction endonuclease subunit S [Lactobacillus sp. W8089]MBI0131273.1 restriction endonuclease subunit S [Lactobacillus sp. W8090]
MNEHNSLPNMRFKGFTDKWKQEKLGNIATVEMNKRIYKNQTNEKGEIPFYKIGTFGKKADSFISNKLFNEYKKKYPYPKVGDILISASGTIGNTIVYKGEDAYFQDSNIVWLNINHNIILNSFLYSFYQIVHWRGIEGSTIKRLYNSNILSTSINYPSVNEQQKIGNLFTKLDKLLYVQQQKIDKLDLLKKALLQKLFPIHDAKTPELRFKEFEDDWKKTRIGKIVQYSNSTYLVKDLKQKKGKNSYAVYDATGRQYYSNSFDMDKKYIAIIKDGSNVGAVKLLPARTSVLSTMGYLGAHNSDIAFDYYLFKKLNFKKYKVGSGIPHIYFSDYKIQVELVPQLSEQQKIGNLLFKSDKLIELENKKLQNLQQFKKCLLQNMFVE